jgi:hypothetical protein
LPEDLAPTTGAAVRPTGVPHFVSVGSAPRQISVSPKLRAVLRSVVNAGMVQLSRTLFPLRTARKSDGGFGNLSDGGCGGFGLPQAVKTSWMPRIGRIVREKRLMRQKSDYQNNGKETYVDWKGQSQHLGL